jgi:hypothetical protein
MTYEWLTDLDQALQAAGLPYTEVNASPYDATGANYWKTRGRPASTGEFAPMGVLCHHTADNNASVASNLAVILRGNSTAPGPISQLYVSREPKIYLIAAGRCNHAGRGKFPGYDCQDLNARLIGIEASNSGLGERWGDAMIDLYAQLVAALCDWYGYDPNRHVWMHHVTGPPCSNYKIDPAGPYKLQPNLPGGSAGSWDLNTWRSFVQTFLGPVEPPKPEPVPGEEMVMTLIHAPGMNNPNNAEYWAVFAGDMDAQGVVNTVRYLGPRLNKVIGFKEDNKTPRLPGTRVLERTKASMTDFTLDGVLPKNDKVPWAANNFYQGD